MKGVITKEHWKEVRRAFGLWKAIRLLFSRKKVALVVLMG
jgi:hypothetical protein